MKVNDFSHRVCVLVMIFSAVFEVRERSVTAPGRPGKPAAGKIRRHKLKGKCKRRAISAFSFALKMLFS